MLTRSPGAVWKWVSCPRTLTQGQVKQPSYQRLTAIPLHHNLTHVRHISWCWVNNCINFNERLFLLKSLNHNWIKSDEKHDKERIYGKGMDALPHSETALVRIPAGSFLCGVCTLYSYMCGASLGSSHIHNMLHRFIGDSRLPLGVNVSVKVWPCTRLVTGDSSWIGPSETAS